MKKIVCILTLVILLSAGLSLSAPAQCSICTKTAQQMGEKPAKGMNGGILYLAAMPFLIVGFVGYKFWKERKE